GGQPHGFEPVEFGVGIDDRRRMRGTIIFDAGKVCAPATGHIHDLYTDVIKLPNRFGTESETDFFDNHRDVESCDDVFDQAQPRREVAGAFGHDRFLDGIDVQLESVGGQEINGGFGVVQRTSCAQVGPDNAIGIVFADHRERRCGGWVVERYTDRSAGHGGTGCGSGFGRRGIRRQRGFCFVRQAGNVARRVTCQWLDLRADMDVVSVISYEDIVDDIDVGGRIVDTLELVVFSWTEVKVIDIARLCYGFSESPSPS